MSKKQPMMVQCRLRRRNTWTVSWIPEQFAHKGKVLKLKSDNGEWVDGWIVESAGRDGMRTVDQCHIASQFWKKHRAATDI